MTKWVKRITVILIVLAVLVFFGIKWAFKDAFGPKYRTVRINLDNKQTLIGSETYSADLAGVFYIVDFKLKAQNSETYKLGTCTFSTEQWNKNIKLYNLANWLVLPVTNVCCAKVLLLNKSNNSNKDTVFSPQNLRYDDLWKSTYVDIPAPVYPGSSRIDSVINDSLFVSYEYRIGDYPPFNFYNQTIIYRFDTANGTFKNIRLLGRREYTKGS